MNKIKTLGAVFTPKDIINIMLDSLPPSVWTHSHLEWLEPSCGNGNMVIEIQNRCNYKVNIDLYEIDQCYADECFLRTKIQPNVTDFLSTSSNKKYDIIVGNPPYQRINKKNGKSRGGKCQLYLEFLDKCLSMLNDDGYILFVHPRNWRKVGEKYLHLFLQEH